MKQKILIVLVTAALFGFGAATPVHAQAENPPVCSAETQLLETLDMTMVEIKTALSAGSTLEELFVAKGLDYAVFVEETAANQLSCIEQALADGKLTQNQADRLTAAVENSLENGELIFDLFSKAEAFVIQKIKTNSFENIADVLGITPETLKTALKNGNTLDEVVESLGIDLDTAFAEWVSLQIEDINQALNSGKLTEDQAETLITRLNQQLEAGFDIKSWNPLKNQVKQSNVVVNPSKDLLFQVLETLDITAVELRQAIQDGQTLDEIAEENGIDLDQLYYTWINDQIEQLNQAVENGVITQERAERLIDRLTDQLEGEFPTDFLNRVYRQIQTSRTDHFSGGVEERSPIRGANN